MILSLFFAMETWSFYITFCHHVTRIKTYVTLDFPFRFSKFETVRSRGTFVLVSDSSHLANMSSLFQRFSFDVIAFLSVHDLPLRVHLETAHPATRRRGEVVATSLCTPRDSRYVSDETPNDVSVACLHDVLLKRRGNVSIVHNNNVPSICLQDVSNKS